MSYRPNLAKYLFFSVLRGLSLGTTIVLWVVFLQKQYGFTLTQVTLLDLPFWIGKFLFEIPTGMVADRYGRRLSLGIGMALNSIIWMVFGLSGSFVILAVTQFVGAFAATFASGADEALLYESVQALNRQEEYAKISGRMRAVETLSAMLSGLAMGVIAEFNLLLPVFITSALSALSLFPILLMKETGGAAAPEGGQPLPYTQIVRQSLAVLNEIPVLRWTIFYLVVLTSIGFYAITFLQPFTLGLGLPIAALGPVLVVMQLSGIAGSLAVPKIQQRLSDRVILVSVPLLLAIFLALTGLVRAVPVLAIMALASFLFALAQPVLLAMVQARIANDTRATLLSMQSFIATIFLTLTEPALGIASDRYGVQSSFLVMSALLVVFFAPLLWAGRSKGFFKVA